MSEERIEDQIRRESRAEAVSSLDRLRNGEELTKSEIDDLLKVITETDLGNDVDQSDFNRLFKMRARLVLDTLNYADNVQDAFGDEQETELEFLVTAFANNWFDEHADVHLSKSGLI